MKKLFRAAIIAQIVLAIAAIGIDLAWAPGIELELQEIYDELSTPLFLQAIIAEEGAELVMLCLAFLGLFVTLIVSTIGLLLFKRWARTLIVVLTVVLIPASAFLGPALWSAPAAALYEIASMLGGAILAAAYLPPLRDEFVKRT